MLTVSDIALSLKLQRKKVTSKIFPTLTVVCILVPIVTILSFSNAFQLPLGKIKEIIK
jgi:hypothetical protein